MSGLENIDRDDLLQELQELLPDPVREETQLDGDVVLVGGDPGEVIVRISGIKVSIAVFSIRWDGPHTPVTRPKQLATLNWQRLPASTAMMTLHGLISAAVELRRAKYRKCEKCGETNPPEWMHDEGICQSCAEEHLGVVHWRSPHQTYAVGTAFFLLGRSRHRSQRAELPRGGPAVK